MLPVLFAYFGPETMLPLTSVVATVVGIFLMFGKNLIRLAVGIIRIRSGARRDVRRNPMPHFRVETESRPWASVEAKNE